MLDLNVNSKPEPRKNYSVENLLLVKPCDGRICEAKSESSINSSLEDKFWTFRIDSSVLFTDVKLNRVLPIESIKEFSNI